MNVEDVFALLRVKPRAQASRRNDTQAQTGRRKDATKREIDGIILYLHLTADSISGTTELLDGCNSQHQMWPRGVREIDLVGHLKRVIGYGTATALNRRH